MDTAVNMEGNISVEDDGTWSYNWAWTYIGTEILSEVYEQILLTTPQGLIIDGKKEEAHVITPGQTYIGTGSGTRNIPGGNTTWSLTVFHGDDILGRTGGSFIAVVAIDN